MPLFEKSIQGHSTLYRIVRDKDDTCVHVLNSSPPNVSFGRDLVGLHLLSWQHLLCRLDEIHLTQGQEVFHWNVTTNASFTIHSMYRAFPHSEMQVDNNNQIWKSNISTTKGSWSLYSCLHPCSSPVCFFPHMYVTPPTSCNNSIKSNQILSKPKINQKFPCVPLPMPKSNQILQKPQLNQTFLAFPTIPKSN